MTDTPKPRRRWYQFSLRTLLLLMALASLVFGGFAYKMRQVQQQRELVRMIHECGGYVNYDYEWPSPPGPKWLRNLFGDDIFANVVAVRFQEDIRNQTRGRDPDAPAFTDHHLLRLQVFAQLEDLNLYDTKVTDAGLIHIAGFKKLKSLSLSSTAVTGSRLVHLQMLTRLRSLSLDGTPVTDSGLAYFQGLTQLESLSLNRTQITDAGLSHLRDLTRLKSLGLYGTQVTDAGLMHLRRLPRLECINIYDTKITDHGYQELQKALPNLEINGICSLW